MKSFVLIINFIGACLFSNAQRVAVSTDRNNILFQEMDNPITIAAENASCRDLHVTTDNGTITGSNGLYLCKPERVGRAIITVTVKAKGKQQKIWSFSFRVKYLIDDQNVVFKVGPYGNGYSVRKDVIQAQLYARAEIWNTDFDARCRVDSFGVRIISVKKCEVKQFENIGNQLSNELRSAFALLEIGDIIVFENIFVTGPSERKLTIKSVVMYVNDL
jgi:GldM C-terminal domain